ncbi:hypothetical protein PUR57_07710 [Streptomyces sp. JV176]|uniref:hypothetical protein n=1 Tax=Streptomyces sp. JV176 TaxID=858630 RepID=UPI002E78F737|nr:hypothetical protein [Streptomyces sp. JV176]MEE1798562.1 hypothetical protein [Streptomyces sp. JV176]
MTSTTDTAQHPDVSEISDLAEGLLPPARSADLRQHLDGCVLCADVHDSLEEIRGLLGTLPGPARMPADVAGRIDAALAAEALLDATTPDDSTALDESPASAEPADSADVSRETSPSSKPRSEPQSEPHSPPRSPAVTSAVTTDTVRADRPAGRPKAATGPGRGGPSRLRRRRTAVLGAVFGTALVGMGVLLLPSLHSSDSGEASKTASSAAGDGDLFSETRLQDRVDTLLASGADAGTESETKAGRPRSMEGDRGGASNSPLLTPAPAVPACIQRGIGSSLSALAAERGTYQGSDAYLVVLPHSGDSTRVQAYVVDATCVKSAPSTDGTVLLTHSYLRR